MSLAQTLWDEARDNARLCLNHPFVQGLADGTLPRGRYRRFIAQDAFFLDVFARGYAHCAATAPDADGRRDFLRLQDGVFEELRLHRSVAASLDINLDRVDPIPSTLAYTHFLEECIRDHPEPGIAVASMTPCMRLYAWLGQELARGVIAEPYRDWIDTYASGEMEEHAAAVEALLDRYGDRQGAAERARYHRAMSLELEFFDGAWKDPADERARE